MKTLKDNCEILILCILSKLFSLYVTLVLELKLKENHIKISHKPVRLRPKVSKDFATKVL